MLFVQGATCSMFTLCVPLNSIKYDSFIVHFDKYQAAVKTMCLEDTFHILIDRPVQDGERDAPSFTVVKRKVILAL